MFAAAPVLFSNVKVEPAPEAAVKPTLLTMPSVIHDIAVKTTAALLNIFFLYIDSVQPTSADVLFEPCGSLLNKREAGWTFAIFPTARTSLRAFSRLSIRCGSCRRGLPLPPARRQRHFDCSLVIGVEPTPVSYTHLTLPTIY